MKFKEKASGATIARAQRGAARHSGKRKESESPSSAITAGNPWKNQKG
ncbi:MAG: hypothetical protein IJW11_00325 [Clostridia bacterium]|nr:hypothetical protein [Clostridia bacterium]